MRNFPLPGQFGGFNPLQRQPTTSVFGTLAFEPNPGALGAKTFVPTNLASGAPLVVVLHGCTQTPEGYERGTGWTHLAERHGFAVLYPEQMRSNNANGCFNWFEPGDMRRGAGEPASIKSMIDRMVANHAIDPARIYITGLSAGAAMTGVMLATYPEMFAGGGLIAGLPYGVARSMPAAFSRMRARGRETDVELGDHVRKASPHNGPWPTVSVWHGTADMTVDAGNADATVAQWRAVHGLDDAPAKTEIVDGFQRRIWADASGRIVVDEFVITGMGHGTPLDSATVESAEVAGAYLLDVGISSTQCLAAAWGLTDAATRTVRREASVSLPRQPKALSSALPASPRGYGSLQPDVQTIIENALRSAGLMR
jgi:poly(hydroxyalkanoate) depolymerase family esterase